MVADRHDYEYGGPDVGDASAASLVSTKLYPPRLRTDLVVRSQLLDRLNSDFDRRLTVVCAPAGYGKSTVTAQWLSRSGIPYAWINLDASDNLLRKFLGVIIAALRSIDDSLATRSETMLSHADSTPDSFLIQQLIGELSETTRPYALVLDDYHLIESPEIHQAVGMLLNQMPHAMRVVIVSRTEPPIPLARMRANGELLHLGAEDLLFDSTESRSFFRDFAGVDLSPSDIDVVHHQTEGWVAALNLVGVALRGLPSDRVRSFARDFTGNIPFVEDYLWEEALERQPADVRDFLIRSSILDSFTAELCEAVTGIPNCSEMIRRCEQANLFVVSLDGKGQWFRFHHLMTDVLRDHLSEQLVIDEIDALHHRAMRWLDHAGLMDEAIRHAHSGACMGRRRPLVTCQVQDLV